jgi:hypothetical protein
MRSGIAMIRSLQLALALILVLATLPLAVSGRGMGGFHGGGGFGGGGFGGGGFGGGGFHPEGVVVGFAGGGFRPQGFGGGMGGFQPQGTGMGAYRPAGFQSGAMGMGGARPQMMAGNGMTDFHDFGGIPSQMGTGGFAPSAGGFRPAEFNGFAPTEIADIRTTPLPSGDQQRPGALGSGALGSGELGAGQYHGEASVPMDSHEQSLVDSINKGGLAHFGLPTDGGMPPAKTGADEHPAAAPIAPHPAAAARLSPTVDRAQAIAAQSWFDDHPAFTPAWAANHAWAWLPYATNDAAWDNAFFEAVSWAAASGWLDPTNPPPQNYDYGNNVVYQDNNVLVNSQPVGTAQQYYGQAQALAVTDARAQSANSSTAQSAGQGSPAQKWLPLGVFGLMPSDAKTPDMIFQLALDKQGNIRGNYFSEVSEKTQPVYGSVDKKTQRAAWTVGDNKKIIIETGLYNLTLDEATALVHLDPDHEKRYVLVRLKQNQSPALNKK